VIVCELWFDARCGDNEHEDGSFILDQRILNGEPEKYEAALDAEYAEKAAKKAGENEEARQRRIAALQRELNDLQNGQK
jgi:hypothetical protein